MEGILSRVSKYSVHAISFALFSAMLESAIAAEPALPPITAAAAILIDRDSGLALGVKNPDQPRGMASTTKMMTALLAIEQNGSNLDAMVGPISSYAAGTQGSRMNLNAGDRISLRDLLYGLLLPSGNDAAVAIAEWISGSEAAFVSLMNQRAQQLGLVNTAYRNPYGRDPTEYGACFAPYTSLPNCGHYSTARDLATLARFAMNQPFLAQIVATVSWKPTTWVDASGNHRKDVLRNDNLLLSSMSYPGANGVKTGETPNAGYCLVASAMRSGRSLISVVLGCSSDAARIGESMQLLDYGFAQAEIPTPVISVLAFPTTVNEGTTAVYTVSASLIPSQPITVFYSMSGQAKLGTDYSLSGVPGQVVIPEGQSSATVTLYALTDNLPQPGRIARMKLNKGTGYKRSSFKKASITIVNVP